MEPNARSLYTKLQTDRNPYVTEAFESASLTIPAIMPEDADALNRSTTQQILPKPWQSLGARGTNNLAAKLVLALLPPTSSFLRYELDPASFEGLPEDQVDAIKTDLEQRLAARERAVMSEINASNIRPKCVVGMKHLIVCGNVLLYMPPSGGIRMFPLNQYVCRRDFMGNVIELIYVEILDRDTVEPKVKAMLDAEKEGDEATEKPVQLYTHVKRQGNRFHAQQEVCDKVVPGTEFSVKIEDSPWLVLRWTAIDGEDYGRGFVEEYRGDLRSLEELSKAINIASLNAAKIIPLISPSSTVTPRRLTQTENGEPIVANADDIVFLQQQKHADMSVARAQRQDLEQALSADFMLTQSIQRHAERVTAEEIRTMAQDLDASFGGVYSTQTQELQLPVARRVEAQLIKRGSIQKLPDGTVKTAIVTGLAAIGRGQELQKLRDGMSMVAELAPVYPTLTERIDEGDLLKRIFIGVGVDTNGLIKSDERMVQEAQVKQQQMQQQQLADVAKSGTGAQVVKQIGDRAAQQNKQPSEAPE